MSRRALLLLPGGLLLAAASLLLAVPQAREWASPLVAVFAYAVTAAGILLGLRFGNVRLVLALIVLVLADLAATRWIGTDAVVGATEARAAVGLLVPLDLAALAWTSERGAWWVRARGWSVVVGIEVLGVGLLLLPATAPVARGLWHALLDPPPLLWPAAGRAVELGSASGLVLALGRFALRPRPTEGGLVWSIVAAFLALGGGVEPPAVTLYLAAGSLTLIVALIETSYALAYRDDLTGLPSRRALNDLLGTIGPRYAVSMVDIDHFKKFNDTYGHQAGDELLRKIATTLMAVGGGGRAFRYGGEEFVVVFAGMSADDAIPPLESLRKTIADSHFTVRSVNRPRKKPRQARSGKGRARVGVTVSIGVADSDDAGPTPGDVVKAADEALYRAKRAGRNRLAS